jgi:hypothetical protein
VPVSADKLASATTSLCANGACAKGVVPPATALGGPPLVPLEGTLASANAMVSDEGDGFTTVSLGGGTTFADGDLYAVTIADASGAMLIDVNRKVTYRKLDDSCGSAHHVCLNASVDLYPNSTSGIQCTSNPCFPAVNIRGTLRLPTNDPSPLSVQFCKNDSSCSQTDASLVLDPSRSFLSGALTGGPLTKFSFTHRPDGAFDFDILLAEDPAAQKNGDTYAVTITSGTTVLASGRVTATYNEPFPNGHQCDAVPCRTADLVLP